MEWTDLAEKCIGPCILSDNPIKAFSSSILVLSRWSLFWEKKSLRLVIEIWSNISQGLVSDKLH